MQAALLHSMLILLTAHLDQKSHRTVGVILFVVVDERRRGSTFGAGRFTSASALKIGLQHRLFVGLGPNAHWQLTDFHCVVVLRVVVVLDERYVAAYQKALLVDAVDCSLEVLVVGFHRERFLFSD